MVQLSRRERQVAALVAEGLTNRAIAKRLFISERTAEYHVEQIRNKLGCHSRTEVAAWVREQEDSGGGRIRSGSLPAQMIGFIGRADDLAKLRALVKEERLVTLIGPGGVGKTRLALKLASGLPWPDGAWWVDLAVLIDANQVWDAIARGVQLAESPRPSLSETVIGHLASKTSILLIDNCEHLLSSVASAVLELLRGCSGIRVLTTSREPLGVPGELTYPVPSLPVPQSAQMEVRQLETNDAVRLFVQRARLARPSFVLDPSNAAAVVEIARRLDGMPLAIELAAARVRSMSPVEILERLRDRFRLLTGGAWSPVPRHQTMSAALDWSYALLAPEERTVFNRLGVFAGGFDLQAAERVCSDSLLPAERIWDVLSRLVDKSMVEREGGQGRSRYRLLDTIRAYVVDRALGTGELEVVRGRHAKYFHDLAEEAEPFLTGSGQAEWLDRLEEEKDNLRAALQWSQQEEPDQCLRLAASACHFWERRIHLAEGRELASLALAADGRPTVARAKLLTAVGRLETWAGLYEPARAHIEESVHILRQRQDMVGLAEALTWKAAWHQVGYAQHDLALQAAEEAASVARAVGDDRALGIALNALGLCHLALSDPVGAVSSLEEGVACLRRGQDGWELAKTMDSLANAQLHSGNRQHAAELWAESIQLSVVVGPPANVAHCANGLAQMAAAYSPRRALRLAGAAATILHGVGWSPGFWDSLVEHWLVEARSKLPPADAEEAWREGASLPIDAVVSLALEEPLLSGGDAKGK
jgi:predicted ATPase/DNA-binding CsgD family transcriptional regulator